jgi:hypothetical protein
MNAATARAPKVYRMPPLCQADGRRGAWCRQWPESVRASSIATTADARLPVAQRATRHHESCDTKAALTVFCRPLLPFPAGYHLFRQRRAVPEPTAIAFLATGGLAAGMVAAARRRRRTGAGS